MPAPSVFINVCYALTILTLAGLSLSAWLNLRRWAKRAKEEAGKSAQQ